MNAAELEEYLDNNTYFECEKSYNGNLVKIEIRYHYCRGPRWGVSYILEIFPLDYDSYNCFYKQFFTTDEESDDIPGALTDICEEIIQIFNFIDGAQSTSENKQEIEECLKIAPEEYVIAREKEFQESLRICCKCEGNFQLGESVKTYPWICERCVDPFIGIKRLLMPGLSSILNNESLYPEQWKAEID